MNNRKAIGEVRMTFHKLDLYTGRYVAGAWLQLWTAAGEMAAEWITEDSCFTLDHLPSGQYRLTEVLTPREDGYVRSEDVFFSAGPEDGHIYMATDCTKAVFALAEAEGGEPAAGAELALWDLDQTKMEEWTSGETAFFLRCLPPGTYRITAHMRDAFEEYSLVMQETSVLQVFQMKLRRI